MSTPTLTVQDRTETTQEDTPITITLEATLE